MWTRHEKYQAVVQGGWHAGNQNLQDVHQALGLLRNDLTHWSREEFGSVKKQLKSLRDRMERVRANSLRSGPTREERGMMHRISELLASEETKTKQRSRIGQGTIKS
jgi:hypothetical protein